MEFVKIMILLMAVVMPIIHSLPTQTTPSELQDGAEGNTNSRKKRCGHGGSDTTTTTEKFRDWDFEHPPKEGDPADPIHKDNRLLPQKRDIKNERGRGQAIFKEVLSSLLNIVRPQREIKNKADNSEESTKQRKKRGLENWFSWLNNPTTTTERFRDLWFENPIKPGDPMEPFVWTNKQFGTTPKPGSLIFRSRRSVDEDYNKFKSNDEEAASLQ